MPKPRKIKPKSRWLQVAEVGLNIQTRVKSFVPLRGYSPNELINYYLTEFNQILTPEEKVKLEKLRNHRGRM